MEAIQTRYKERLIRGPVTVAVLSSIFITTLSAKRELVRQPAPSKYSVITNYLKTQ